MLVCCPTPTGFGDAVTCAVVGTLNGGVCAATEIIGIKESMRTMISAKMATRERFLIALYDLSCDYLDINMKCLA